MSAKHLERLLEETRGLSSDEFVRMLQDDGGPTGRDLVSTQDLAAELDVSVRTLRRWNNLPNAPKRYRQGRCMMYRRADVQHWFERSNRTAGAGDDVGGGGAA